MKLSGSQLMKMSVYTAAGVHVGRVTDFSIDVDTGVVLEYAVKTGFRSVTIIARERVIRIETDRLIVEDRVIDRESASEAVRPSLTPNTSVQVIQDETS